jgi:Cu/Ag efflux protein CusF
MKVYIFALAFAAFAAGAPAGAQNKADEHGAHHPAGQSGTAAMTDGEVRRINKELAKITLRHGRIDSLDMPPMTMVFHVKDPTLLDAVKVGDKVLFSAARERDGTFVVTAIKPAR